MNECLHILGFQSVLKQMASAGRLVGCYKLQAPRPPILGGLELRPALLKHFEIYNVEVRKCHLELPA